MDSQTITVICGFIAYAEEGKHIPFTLIQSWEEYLAVYKKLLVLKLIIKSLRSSNKRLLKMYCKGVAEHDADVTALQLYKTIEETLSFYQEDVKTVLDMLDEYEIYLLAGNLLSFRPRPEDRLWDHRKVDLLWNKL